MSDTQKPAGIDVPSPEQLQAPGGGGINTLEKLGVDVATYFDAAKADSAARSLVEQEEDESVESSRLRDELKPWQVLAEGSAPPKGEQLKAGLAQIVEKQKSGILAADLAATAEVDLALSKLTEHLPEDAKQRFVAGFLEHEGLIRKPVEGGKYVYQSADSSHAPHNGVYVPASAITKGGDLPTH